MNISVIFGEAPQLLLQLWSCFSLSGISLSLLSFTVKHLWLVQCLLETLSCSALLLVALVASELCNNALLLVYQMYSCCKFVMSFPQYGRTGEESVFQQIKLYVMLSQ